MEALEARELLCANVPCAHSYINLYDYEGNLVDNWYELVNGHHGHHDHDHHDDHDDHDHHEGSALAAPGLLANNGQPSSDEYNAVVKWPQAGGAGTPLTITYSYSNLLDGNLGGSLTNDQLRSAVEEALGLWATYAPINFVEVVDSGPAVSDLTQQLQGNEPDLRIGHHAIDGSSSVLAHAYYPFSTDYWGISGDIHLDTAENWKLGAGGGIDIVEVMTHEIGHAIGLGHESGNNAIMNPYYGGRFSGLGTGFLLSDDVNGVRANYGTGVGTVSPISTNTAPELDYISNVIMSTHTDSVDVNLSASDDDGDSLAFTATLVYDAHMSTAYALDQQHGFSDPENDYYNHRGANERYLQAANDDWFYILPTGQVYEWGGTIEDSTIVATLSGDYHTDLAKLHSASAPTAGPGDVTLSLSGNTLTIDPAANYTGTIRIDVTVSDGEETDSQSFDVSVDNNAPTVDAIDDQDMPYTQDTRVIGVSASDADGDSLTYSAQAYQVDLVAQTAYDLNQQEGFKAASSEYYNHRGAGEKYFLNQNDDWFFMLGDGRLYRWGGSIGSSTMLCELSPQYHQDLDQLFNAPQPTVQNADASLSWSGSNLTVDPDSNFRGTFTVDVSVSDGINTTVETFSVTVSNHAPTIGNIDDQQMSPAQDTRVIGTAINDADGDSLTITTSAYEMNPSDVLAYQLDQTYNFQAASDDYYNYRGQGEKYFHDGAEQWHFIMPNGQVYRWSSSMAESVMLGTLDSSYHADLNKLFDVGVPQQQASTAQVSLSGSNLTIDPADGYTGTFYVNISVTDGTHVTTEAFSVTVANQAPTIASINDQVISQGNSAVVGLSINDADGDSVTTTVTTQRVDPMELLARQLDQQHDLHVNNSEYFNYRGYNEKYMQGNNGWYFMLPNGQLYQWSESIAGSTLLGTLDSSFHENLSLLHNSQEPTVTNVNATVNISGSTLTVTPPNGLVGSFDVVISVSDGLLSSSTTFSVTVNEAVSAPSSASFDLHDRADVADQSVRQALSQMPSDTESPSTHNQAIHADDSREFELAVDEFVSDGDFDSPYVASTHAAAALPSTPADSGFDPDAIDEFFDALDELLASAE